MKTKIFALFGYFVLFFYFIHIAYTLPELLNGHLRPPWVPTNRHRALVTLAEIVLGFLFCVTTYLTLYYFYPREKLLHITILLPVFLAVSFFLNFYTDQFIQQQSYFLRFYFPNHLFFFSSYTLFGAVFYFIRYTHNKEIKEKELLIQTRQTELSFLRSQLNPHFLFNALNNIYSLVYHHSNKALPAIAGLSELLRYSLYHAKDLVLLEEEIRYIRKFIELQQLRFKQPAKVSFTVKGDTAHIFIPPLLFISFIENAFKHAALTNNGNGITAEINCTENNVIFSCVNTIGDHQKDSSSGIGLENIKKRLLLLYPDTHELQIKEHNNQFFIRLLLHHGK
jgi:sensor histidine kinase YesM